VGAITVSATDGCGNVGTCTAGSTARRRVPGRGPATRSATRSRPSAPTPETYRRPPPSHCRPTDPAMIRFDKRSAASPETAE
jgi:hypothetical protein